MLAYGALPDGPADTLPEGDEVEDDVYLSDEPPPELELDHRPLGLAARTGTTGAKVGVPALEEPVDTPGSPSRAEQLRRLPPRGPRPTLMPEGYDMPPKLPTSPKVADPGLVRPVRAAVDSPKPTVGQQRESSDVIQVFQSNTGQPVPARPMADRSSPGPRTVPPPQGQNRLIRKAPPPQPVAPPAPQPAQHASYHPGRTSAPLAPQPVPAVLPLVPERMVGLIAEHRSRLQTLDFYARALEVGAGLFGTISLSLLIAVLVSVLVGGGVGLVVAATALLAGFGGLAVTGVMLAMATSMRHLASTSAQLAALLEALSTPPR